MSHLLFSPGADESVCCYHTAYLLPSSLISNIMWRRKSLRGKGRLMTDTKSHPTKNINKIVQCCEMFYVVLCNSVNQDLFVFIIFFPKTNRKSHSCKWVH